MNVIFLTLCKISSILYERNIYTDLLHEFCEKGHNVYVVTPNERVNRTRTHLVEEGRCKILRVKVGNIQKTNIIEKGISTVLIKGQFKCAINKYFSDKHFDLILYSTPPITIKNVVQYLKNRDKAITYLMLKDIFPQNAVDIGMLSKKNPIYKYFRKNERELYLISDHIGCMSKANVAYLLKNNNFIDKKSVEVCPNSISPSTIKSIDKKRIRENFGLPKDRTIFVYGGNLGRPQGIDFLIECLKANEKNEQVYFIIAGTGTEYDKIKKYFDTKKHINAKLVGQLTMNDYDSLLNVCDVGLVLLDKRFTIPNFPSRILSYMQASIPVLAATDSNTDVRDVIDEGGFGYWCQSGDIKSFQKLVQKLCNQELRMEMGANARDYLEKHYTAKRTYDIIMAHFIK